MWARVAEIMLGVWLSVSPFVFRGTAALEEFVLVDRVTGFLVILFALLSFWSRTGWAHFLTAILAVALAARAYVGWEAPGPPAAQNELMAGLLLLLLAIIPNECSEPPKPWRQQI